MSVSSINPDKAILVSDFDGTMTAHDFYKLAVESLMPADVPDYWARYRDGTMTHFEALRAYFSSIQGSESEVLDVVRRMQLDEGVPAAVQRLKEAGWRVVIASAGCEWYIRHLLGNSDVEIHANPGRFETGKGLLMEMPTGSLFASPTLGINKAGVVRHYLNQGFVVAFAGDGFPDADPAILVSDDLRFARSDLADTLRSQGFHFRSYQVWSDIADMLSKRYSIEATTSCTLPT